MIQRCIKTDPAFQEDQEDLLMSYLNPDYMAPSTASPSPTAPKFSSIQELNYATAIASSGYDHNDATWYSAPSTPNDDLFRQHQPATTPCFHTDVLNTTNLQFVMPSHDQMQHQSIAAYMSDTTINMVCSPPYFNLQQNNHNVQHPPASPRSLSSYSSSSDSEQPKKKRGRKKRDSSYSVASSSSCESLTSFPLRHNSTIPTVIAPAPAKHLPSILPAASNSTHSRESFMTKKELSIDIKSTLTLNQHTSGSTTRAPAIYPVVNSNTDLQKAATIIKRQERLIKNRAAALLSRKRKREHLSALEEQCTDLSSANQSLLEKVSQLENENLELKNKLNGKQQTAGSEKSSSDIIYMIILCYMIFIVPFSSYSKGLGGLFTYAKLAHSLTTTRPPTLTNTSTSSSFQLRPHREECTSQRKKKIAFTALHSAERVKRGRFRRVSS
ncbi:hypothetical protein BD408DRAFT_446424 [Parasitella parasitica]|nr:hypothetical protein BD408DRAFT_446424 [Parasitella parasitica]